MRRECRDCLFDGKYDDRKVTKETEHDKIPACGRSRYYYDFLMSAGEPECNAAIQRMVPKINLEQIKGFIEEVPYITELQKTFYKRYITARFERILKPAYEMNA